MSKRGGLEFLSDIREALRRIESYIEGLNYQGFMKDVKVQDAVVRNLEIIGEATKNISGALKKKYPQIPWQDLAKVRDKLIHHYFGVNLDVVWNIVKKELPSVLSQIEKILDKEIEKQD